MTRTAPNKLAPSSSGSPWEQAEFQAAPLLCSPIISTKAPLQCMLLKLGATRGTQDPGRLARLRGPDNTGRLRTGERAARETARGCKHLLFDLLCTWNDLMVTGEKDRMHLAAGRHGGAH